jgi:outer membrane protein OmpU
MKKVLLASTALVLSAGVAAADVTVGGDGRMGVINNFDPDNTLSFTSRIRIAFTASGETDGGLSFGGSIRADNSGGLTVNNPPAGVPLDVRSDVVPGGGVNGVAGSVFISGDFGRLSMGDVAGAPEAAVGDLSGVGLTGLGDLNEMTYLSNRGAAARSAARYDYTFGDFGVHVSADNPVAFPNSPTVTVEDPDTGEVTTRSLRTENETYGVAVTYSGDLFSAGLGWEDRDGVGSHIIGGVTVDFAGAKIKGIFGQADFDGGDKADQWGLSVDYTFDATTLTAFYTDRDAGLGSEAFGIGAAYDLGGGASLRAGYVSNENISEDAFDFGISMRF